MIRSLHIPEYQQFGKMELDLTYPEGHPKAGKPLEKVCLIGRNGTGKTTLLKWIADDLIDKQGLGDEQFEELRPNIIDENQIGDLRQPLTTIFSPAEAKENLTLDTGLVPEVKLKDALQNWENVKPLITISNAEINSFWELVVYLYERNRTKREKFENEPENIEKTKKQLIEEFDASNPSILKVLAEVWEPILRQQHLKFDTAFTHHSIGRLDNLEAYVRHAITGKPLEYRQLSSGTRHLLVRLGYFAAIFNYLPENTLSIALIDEVENSLYPDLLMGIVDRYLSISSNTQFFFATHSPIVAAQFEPCERFILDYEPFQERHYDDAQKVLAKRGIAPEGDDPNDLLLQDFGLENVYGEKGREMWREYVDLRIQMIHESDPQKKKQLTAKFLEIGQRYKFGKDEKSA